MIVEELMARINSATNALQLGTEELRARREQIERQQSRIAELELELAECERRVYRMGVQ